METKAENKCNNILVLTNIRIYEQINENIYELIYLRVTPGLSSSFPPGLMLISASTLYSPALKTSYPSTSPPTDLVPARMKEATNCGLDIYNVDPGLLECNRYGRYSILAKL